MGKTTTINSITNPLVLAISIFGILTTITLLSAIFIMNQRSVSAESTSASASVNVSSACTFSSNTDSTHSTEIAPETWQENIGKTSLTVKCNDSGGYAVYAVGYSNDEWNNNTLVGPNSNVINTGTATTGSNSTWSMKLLPGEGDTASIVSPYNDYATVPGDQNDDGDDTNNSYTKVATYNSTTLGNAGSSFAVTYKSYIAKNQAAGDYTGKVKFTMVHPSTAEAPEQKPSKIYMQDFTLSSCMVNVGQNGNLEGIGDELTVYDRRDESDYTIRYINGACWMTQNLRITGTISAADSNFIGSDFNVSQYDLKINGDNECNSTNGYDDVCSRTPDFTDLSIIGGDATVKSVGAWYNYKAATAGTVSTNSNLAVATRDICPSNWHIPTGPAIDPSSEFYALFNSTGTRYWLNNNYLSAFNAVGGGVYSNGVAIDPEYGTWWTASSGRLVDQRYILSYDSVQDKFFGPASDYRYIGEYIRCILSN